MNKLSLLKHFAREPRRWLAPAIGGVSLFLALVHHVLDFWEFPAAAILAVLLLGIPLVAALMILIVRKLSPHVEGIAAARLVLLALSAALIAAVVAWALLQAPSDYQTLTITPHVSGDQVLGVIELKAGGRVIRIRQAALASGWVITGGTAYASGSSEPLTVSFRCPANSEVQLLLITSPQGGTASVVYEGKTVEADLAGPTSGAMGLLFTSTYRGLPGGAFIAALVLIDLLGFGTLVFLVLLVQELGERSEAGRNPVSPRFGLAILIGAGLVLHLFNALSTSLFVGPDSISYLQGAAHLAQFGNYDGVPVVRGPVTSSLLAPLMWALGRNAWGIKILFHLLAVACIPVSHQIGWRLSGNKWVAFLSGLAAVLSPDLYYYANYVMSDIPSLLLILLFFWFLILGLQTREWRWMLAALLAASFAMLTRVESAVLLAFGAAAFAADVLLDARRLGSGRVRQLLIRFGLALGIALLPIVLWFNHNQRLHGLWGMTDYAGHALYDGWIYFGNASRIDFNDPDSEAVQAIEAVLAKYPVETDRSGVATGGEILPSMLKSGYTTEQTYELYERAALDIIRRNPQAAFQVLLLKLRKGLQPEVTYDFTYRLPGEAIRSDDKKLKYFDLENLSIPPLIVLQRSVDAWVNAHYPQIFPGWVLLCGFVLAFSLLRRPSLLWAVLVVCVVTRITVASVMSIPFWRFTLSAWLPLQSIVICWLFVFAAGLKVILRPAEPRLRSVTAGTSEV